MRSKKDEREFEGMTAADFTTPPPGWVAPPPVPPVLAPANVPQSVFDEIAREQLARFESIWRPRANGTGKVEFGKLRVKSALEETKTYLGDVANEKWPTLNDCIPLDSILDVVDDYFLKHTDIPRELPFFTVLHYITAMMMQEGAARYDPDRRCYRRDHPQLRLARRLERGRILRHRIRSNRRMAEACCTGPGRQGQARLRQAQGSCGREGQEPENSDRATER